MNNIKSLFKNKEIGLPRPKRPLFVRWVNAAIVLAAGYASYVGYQNINETKTKEKTQKVIGLDVAMDPNADKNAQFAGVAKLTIYDKAASKEKNDSVVHEEFYRVIDQSKVDSAFYGVDSSVYGVQKKDIENKDEVEVMQFGAMSLERISYEKLEDMVYRSGNLSSSNGDINARTLKDMAFKDRGPTLPVDIAAKTKSASLAEFCDNAKILTVIPISYTEYKKLLDHKPQ